MILLMLEDIFLPCYGTRIWKWKRHILTAYSFSLMQRYLPWVFCIPDISWRTPKKEGIILLRWPDPHDSIGLSRCSPFKYVSGRDLHYVKLCLCKDFLCQEIEKGLLPYWRWSMRRSRTGLPWLTMGLPRAESRTVGGPPSWVIGQTLPIGMRAGKADMVWEVARTQHIPIRPNPFPYPKPLASQ